jgi:hypothetical protein
MWAIRNPAIELERCLQMLVGTSFNQNGLSPKKGLWPQANPGGKPSRDGPKIGPPDLIRPPFLEENLSETDFARLPAPQS